MSEAMERPWRVDGHWGVEIVSEGLGEAGEDGTRVGDTLIATAQSTQAADRIVEDHNALLAVAGYIP